MASYIVIPDSFKGTLSSVEVCRIVEEVIYSLEPEARVRAIPVADGGEGTVDAFLAAVGGRRVSVACAGPCGEPLTACYGLLPDGTAVVEMAAAAGLPLVGECRNPERTTTYGVGRGRRRRRAVLGRGGQILCPCGRHAEGYRLHRRVRHGSGAGAPSGGDHVRH